LSASIGVPPLERRRTYGAEAVTWVQKAPVGIDNRDPVPGRDEEQGIRCPSTVVNADELEEEKDSNSLASDYPMRVSSGLIPQT
jgi:hypothetical protein